MKHNPTIKTVRGRARHVDLDDLTEAQIEKLPVHAFSLDEWDQLETEMKEYLLDKDETSQANIQALVKVFVEPYKWTQDPSEDYVFDMVDDEYFSTWLREKADHLVEVAEDRGHASDVEEIVELYENEGDGWPAYSVEQIHQAIDEALQDTDNYDKSTSDEYSAAFFKDGRSEDSLSIDTNEVEDAVEDLFPEELDRAAEEIDSETDGLFRGVQSHRSRGKLTGADLVELSKKNYIEVYVQVSYYVDWEPNWEKIKEVVGEKLSEIEPPEPESDEARIEREAREARSFDERKVYVFKDGFYWLELIPAELRAEGARTKDGLSHCIGDAGPHGHGYPEALAGGKARAFSLRAPSGKRKLTLWADINTYPSKGPVGEVTSISQIKGKGNRLVGWDLGDAGGKNFKEDEVKKTVEFIDQYLHFSLLDVPDLRSAVAHILKQGDAYADKLLGSIPGWEKRFKHLVKSDGEPEENPAGTCDHCGGAAVGFCRPYQDPAESELEKNPSSSVIPRRRGETATQLAKRAAKYMSDDDTALFLIGEEAVAQRCRAHAAGANEPHVDAVEILWGVRSRCDVCPSRRRR